MEETPNNSKRRIESLGWLTESALLPKKQKAIEGVGASSIMELRAQLYRTQEEAKRAKEAAPDADLHRARRKPLPNDTFSHKNAGVDGRDHGDKLHLKAIKDGSASYAALEKKAELYSKLVQGELLDEEEEEKYCVDFLSKSVSEHKLQQSEGDNKDGVPDRDVRTDDNVSLSYSDGKRAGLGWTGHIGVGEEHKRLVREVNEETTEARENASLLKQRRQMQAEKNREKLRQAFLKKKIEKLKAAKAAENTQLSDSSCADSQSGIVLIDLFLMRKQRRCLKKGCDVLNLCSNLCCALFCWMSFSLVDSSKWSLVENVQIFLLAFHFHKCKAMLKSILNTWMI